MTGALHWNVRINLSASCYLTAFISENSGHPRGRFELPMFESVNSKEHVLARERRLLYASTCIYEGVDIWQHPPDLWS